MMRVLVVDDQPDIRELLLAILGLQGYDASGTLGGKQALRLLASGYSPDLITLDVQMPEMDGWDTLAEIRRRYGERPRVILCTVKGHPRDLLRGWELGCDGYVWKPFDLKALVQEVADVLARPEQGRERVRGTAIAEAHALLSSLRA